MKSPFKHTPPHGGQPEVGSRWAYRARAEEPLVEVEVLRLGEPKPPHYRVKVQFVDDDHEGREKWVPATRLKVPWRDVQDFQAREERWRRINAVAQLRHHDPDEVAAWEAIGLLIPDALIGPADHGVAHLPDVQELARFLGLDPAELTGHPASFEEDGELLVPWPITMKVAMTAVARDPDPVVRHVLAGDERAAQEAIHGDGEHSAESLARVDQWLGRPIRDVLRRWAGDAAMGKGIELTKARAEAKRLRSLLTETISFLKQRGHHHQARKLLDAIGPNYGGADQPPRSESL